MDASTPDYANEANKDQKPDDHQITIVVSQTQDDWVDKFEEFKGFFTNIFADTNLIKAWKEEALDQFKESGEDSTNIRTRIANAYTMANQKVVEEVATLKDAVGTPGHAWVRLSTHVKGELQKLYTFGFYPRKNFDPTTMAETGGYEGFLKGGPGQVRHPDTIHEGDTDDFKRMYDYKVGAKQFARALAKAQARYENPPPYVLMLYSCATFVREVVKAAGKNFPGKGLFPKSSFTPGYLFKALKEKSKAYGYGVKEKELTEEDKKDPKKKKKKEKWLEKKKDPLHQILEEVEEKREERQEKGRDKLRADVKKKEKHERFCEEIADKGISTKEALLLLPLDTLGLLYGLMGEAGQGGELIAKIPQEIEGGFAVSSVVSGLESASRKFKDLSDDMRPITLASLGHLDAQGAPMVANLLGISMDQLNELKALLGVTPEMEQQKLELGRKRNLPEDALRAMTHSDMVIYEILRELKSGGGGISVASITKAIYEWGFEKEDLPRLTNLTGVGLDQIGAMLQKEPSNIKDLLIEVQVLLGGDPWAEGEVQIETPEPESEGYGEQYEEESEEHDYEEGEGSYMIAGLLEQTSYVFTLDEPPRPMCALPGGARVTGLGYDPKLSGFVQVRFTTDEGGEQTGRVHEGGLERPQNEG
jgi:hypothetical protein